jgi:hypothetical protein
MTLTISHSYRGLAQNTVQLMMLFGLSNLVLAQSACWCIMPKVHAETGKQGSIPLASTIV